MKTVISLDHADISRPETELHVFLAYENLAAALRASETLTALSRKAPEGVSFKYSPWSFSALGDSLLRSQAWASAERAHLIVIAACGVVPGLPAMIESWLERCLARPRTERLAVAALFHGPDGPDDASSPRVRSVQRIALKAGCAFFAPGVNVELACVV